MRKIPALLAMWCAWVAVAGAQDAARRAPAPPYTMATYHLVMLKPGPEAPRLGNTTEGNKVVQAHVQSMYKLAGEGTYLAAGPFLDGLDISGVIVVKAPSPERAKEIAAEDPAVKAGMFVAEVASFMAPEGWFGSWAPFGKFEKVFFGFLVNGPNRSQDAETAKRLQAEHLAYMEGQANEGKIVLAGPFTSAEGTRRGIVVYRVADEAEARRRGEGDPMIKAGRLALDLHPWQVPIGALPVTGK
jgi:uncharacterized protein YciI